LFSDRARGLQKRRIIKRKQHPTDFGGKLWTTSQD
jgi:hypothetical protein